MSTPITYRHELMDRYRLVYDWIPRSTGKLLDIGCGNGVFSHWLRDRAALVVGSDHNAAQLADARRTFPGLCGVGAAGEGLPFGDDVFDAVVMSDVLEHMDNDQAAIDEALRVLKPGGLLIVSLPNRGPLAWLDGDNLVNRFVLLLSKLRIPKRRSCPGLRRTYYQGFRFEKHRHYSLAELEHLARNRAEVETVHYGGTALWPLCYLVEKGLEVFAGRPLVTTDYRRLRRIRARDFRRGFGRWSYNLVVKMQKPARNEKAPPIL